jgi:hypothetical protein
MDYTIVHYQDDPKNFNVKCRNGSAHVRRSTNIKAVTCELCKSPSKLKKFFNDLLKH